MTIKRLIPKMLLVAGLALTILVSAPSRTQAAPPNPLEVHVKQQEQTHTVPVTDSNGNTVGTQTTTVRGLTTTVTTTYTAGYQAGTTITARFGGSLGTIQSESVKFSDGSNRNTVFDATGGKIATTTSPDGTVRIEKYSKGGGGADVVTSVTLQTTRPNGTVATQTLDPTTGKPTGLTLKDSMGNVTNTVPDGKGGFTATVAGEHGRVETITYDTGGKLTGLTIKDSKGNVTTALPDGKGGFTSAVTGDKGKVATSSYDADGKLTGETTKDKNGKVISSTSTTYDAKGGSTSVTKDKNGKVVSSTVYDKDGKVVSQSGKKQIMTLGPGGQATGGTQTSQGSGKHKDKEKFQAEVFHHDKDKPNVQDSGSSGASSGSGQQMHHKRR